MKYIIFFYIAYSINSFAYKQENQQFKVDKDVLVENDFRSELKNLIKKYKSYGLFNLREISEGLKELRIIVQDKKLLKSIKKKEKNIEEIFIGPTSTTCSSATYDTHDIKLEPRNSLYLKVPYNMQDRKVNFVNLAHRQDGTLDFEKNEWDMWPGLTSIQIYSKNNWYYWGGSSSGENGAKFAEPNDYEFEYEGLYEWEKYGHKKINTKKQLKGSLAPKAIRAMSVGYEAVYIREITLKVNPPKESFSEEIIFTPNTEFNIGNSNKEWKFGGGQKFFGTFPNAYKLYNNFMDETSEFKTNLIKDKKLSAIYIACGDSHQNKLKNRDGGWGQKGNAKLHVGIKNASGKIHWLLSYENVPPEGVLIASPTTCNDTIKKGDKLIIQSTSDSTYLMGIHIGYQ